jgi:hypothetical protein
VTTSETQSCVCIATFWFLSIARPGRRPEQTTLYKFLARTMYALTANSEFQQELLSGSLAAILSYHPSREKSKMEDWLDDLAKKGQEKYQAQRQAEEWGGEEQSRKQVLEWQFWNELSKALHSDALEYNKKFGGVVIKVSGRGDTSLGVVAQFTKKIGKRTKVSWYQNRNVVEWEDDGASMQQAHTYILEVVGDKVLARGGGNDPKLTPQDLSREIITFVAT